MFAGAFEVSHVTFTVEPIVQTVLAFGMRIVGDQTSRFSTLSAEAIWK